MSRDPCNQRGSNTSRSKKAIPLPIDFQPTADDILCGRGAECLNHEGNIKFRHVIEDNLDRYIQSKTKSEKSLIIREIVQQLNNRGRPGGFIRKDLLTRRYFEVGDFAAREKTSQAFRDALANKSKSDSLQKSSRKSSSQVDNNPTKMISTLTAHHQLQQSSDKPKEQLSHIRISPERQPQPQIHFDASSGSTRQISTMINNVPATAVSNIEAGCAISELSSDMTNNPHPPIMGLGSGNQLHLGFNSVGGNLTINLNPINENIHRYSASEVGKIENSALYGVLTENAERMSNLELIGYNHAGKVQQQNMLGLQSDAALGGQTYNASRWDVVENSAQRNNWTGNISEKSPAIVAAGTNIQSNEWGKKPCDTKPVDQMNTFLLQQILELRNNEIQSTRSNWNYFSGDPSHLTSSNPSGDTTAVESAGAHTGYIFKCPQNSHLLTIGTTSTMLAQPEGVVFDQTLRSPPNFDDTKFSASNHSSDTIQLNQSISQSQQQLLSSQSQQQMLVTQSQQQMMLHQHLAQYSSNHQLSYLDPFSAASNNQDSSTSNQLQLFTPAVPTPQQQINPKENN